ncbi:hypothetical protein [Phenylobacterium sp.]|uniref:hypothetical protein n=1 Tax=Phenylobacterium sp. TaxID=1871053 RepID=UPI0035B01948
MARTKHSPEFDIVVAGEAYVWRLQRQPVWSSDPKERRGMAVAVRHAEGQREAVLEFPPGRDPRFGLRQLNPAQIPPELVARAIASAIEAGWEPLSRGKSVQILVDETGA